MTMAPTINIGKAGLTDNMVSEIQKQLKRHGTVRVKVLPSAEDRKAIVDSLAHKVGARVKAKVGFVVTLEAP